jgi:galactose-1-phosphate uridylyltransferase
MTSKASASHNSQAAHHDKGHGDHPDAAYIKREDIGLVVSKGLAVLFKTQPNNPVDFLAKWLLNYSNVEKTALSD